MAGSQRTRPYNAANAGATSVAEAEITKSAAAARQLIASLPLGAVILAAWVEVLEAFNAGTSNLVTVGYGAIGAGTADDFVATVTEATPGVYGQATPGAAVRRARGGHGRLRLLHPRRRRRHHGQGAGVHRVRPPRRQRLTGNRRERGRTHRWP
jgi:hypothetical protein